ncbi:tol-pal system protein YbgF [Paramagnetospirillum caucaseum]|uniref:tol-pal system protein YbgF n=1 Tax=Paramagnetospirillum caucaseum TaxID=1244869 RepID=UPI00034C8593|nr:tol-pal system protein YbgF [Paramagnetospirillum caucaseum]
MRRLVLATAFSALLLGAAPIPAALAQTDTRALYDRIERLERDLMTMQAQAARGGGSTVVRSPAASDGSVAGTTASRLEDRLNELEDANRFLTGKIEEANFKASQLAKQIERLQADLDLRFKDLEGARGGQPQASAQPPQSLSMPGPSATTPSGAPVLIPPKGVNPGANSADNDGPAPGPQNLGSMPAGVLKKGEAQAQQQAAKATPPKDAQSAYEEAYALAQKGDYNGAEQGFQAFLKAHPNHQLAGNAQYWLGDIAFSQKKDFAASAKLFGEAYKKYPKHTKAPDMLYKLGASFGHLQMKDQACRTYVLLFAEHPDMADRIKRAATGDKQRLGCK